MVYGSIIRVCGLFVAGILLAVPAQKATPGVDYVAFRESEFLRYRLDYKGINGGEATFEIKKESKIIAGEPHYHLYVTGRSNKVVDRIYKVRDVYESFISKSTLLPSAFFRDVREGGYQKNEYYLFNQSLGLVKVAEKMHEVDPNQTFDLVSAFYYLRCIDFSKAKPGYKVQVNSFFDGGIFPMGVEYLGKQTIKTSLGKVRCRVFSPILITGRIFKDQSDMKLYVSDDKNQIPILIESEVYLGTVRAMLKEYKNLRFPFSALEK
jgi:hypothetical protein